jgi:hypothetical protein
MRQCLEEPRLEGLELAGRDRFAGPLASLLQRH